MNYYNWLHNHQKLTIAIITIFYTVGLAGLSIPYTFPLFQVLTPLAILLSFILTFIYHLPQSKLSDLPVFIFIILGGIVIEIIGVKTGVIFGSYRYGQSLGFKILDTPVIIGINWLLLVYSSAAIFRNLKFGVWIKSAAGAALMTFYDIFLEQVAPPMDMWYWKNNIVPLQNYLAWFIVAFVFHIIFQKFKVLVNNKIARFVFYCQLIFFIVLTLIFTIV